MVHTFIGNLGHFFVILAFIAALVSAYAYFTQTKNSIEDQSWAKLARWSFGIHAFAVLGIIFSLFFIIYNHYFEYHYAWSHASKNLPTHYMISCFWEGQEGSFLLWMFWHAVLGAVLIFTNKRWEAPVMSVFMFVQAFLASMILGVVIFNIKIGSSPFILLRDVLDVPVFALNPDFVPEDGTGLNPLLQNYWMVIHPPVLFLGFATTLIPFSYCIAGLWQKRFKSWIRPALPWALFSALMLGVGILMGAYWAYETLNFGGYWNWDPVENAVYVPWLILIAAIHTMIAFKKSSSALKTAIILSITTFILILYSTFLTRSGILGESSVHSFTDLGMSGQLLLYLLVFTILSVLLLVKVWKELPSDEKEVSTYSREFWIFIGATTLCLMGFQVLVPTSIPVYNSIVELFGGISNLAPPADQVGFYTKFQLWFAVAVALLSGTGQFFWWKKMDRGALKEALTLPIIVTLIISAIVFIAAEVQDITYIIVLTAAIYSLVANAFILFQFGKKNMQLSGGAVAHMGIAMMLIGILFSSGYNKVVSLNTSGLVYHREFPEEVNRENVLLWLHEPRQMEEYKLTYRGQHTEVIGFPDYVPSHHLQRLEDPHYALTKRALVHEEKTVYEKGEIVKIYPESIYFEVNYEDEKGKSFILYPRVQISEAMPNPIYSPDIYRAVSSDLYTHVSTFPDPENETEWSQPETIRVKAGQQFFANDFVAVMEGVEKLENTQGLQLGPDDVAIKAKIKIFGKEDVEYIAEPLYIIKDQMVGKLADEVFDLGVRINFVNIIPEEDIFEFEIETTQKDYIIMKALQKPFINILWMGTLVLVLGFGMAIRRRYSDFIKMRDKGTE